jgi:hypothetical protein
MNKPDDTQKLPEWQSKLKALDALITETIFTEAKMKDFQKHPNFKKISEVEGLLKKVMEKDAADETKFKVKKDFIDDYLKKEEAEITDLGKMIEKLDAEKIIKLIMLYEYDKNDADEKKKEKRLKYS